MAFLFIGNYLINLILNRAMKKLWITLNSLAILISFCKLALPLPLNVDIVYKAILNILNFDFLPTEVLNTMFQKMFKEDDIF